MRAGVVALGVLLSTQVGVTGVTNSGLFHPLPPAQVYSGCGCSFSQLTHDSGREGPVLFSSNYEGSARIASSGGVIQLLGGRSDVECRPPRVGAGCVLKYQADQVRFTVTVKATWVCPSGDEYESCEVVRLQGQMTGRIGKAEDTVEVRGDCGC